MLRLIPVLVVSPYAERKNMKSRKALLNKHASRYIATVFANPLKDAGFICPDDKLLCWYRTQNEEVINSIIFRSLWPKLPLLLEIGYGIFPPFAMPIQIKNVNYNGYPDKELFTCMPIVENYPNGGTKVSFSHDAQVFAPLQDGRGIYTFTNLLLPVMDRIQTIQDAYCFHKNRRINHPMTKIYPSEEKFGSLSKTFIEMALWVDDREMYNYAIVSADKAVTLYERLISKYPQRQCYLQELAAWKRLQGVLKNNERERYIVELVCRMASNYKILKDKYLSGQGDCLREP